MTAPAKAFRFVVFGRPMAPWRATQREALLDALDASCATRDEGKTMIWLTVPADIEATSQPVPVRSRPQNGPTSCATLSRIDRTIARRRQRKSAVFR